MRPTYRKLVLAGGLIIASAHAVVPAATAADWPTKMRTAAPAQGRVVLDDVRLTENRGAPFVVRSTCDPRVDARTGKREETFELERGFVYARKRPRSADIAYTTRDRPDRYLLGELDQFNSSDRDDEGYFSSAQHCSSNPDAWPRSTWFHLSTLNMTNDRSVERAWRRRRSFFVRIYFSDPNARRKTTYVLQQMVRANGKAVKCDDYEVGEPAVVGDALVREAPISLGVPSPARCAWEMAPGNLVEKYRNVPQQSDERWRVTLGAATGSSVVAASALRWGSDLYNDPLRFPFEDGAPSHRDQVRLPFVVPPGGATTSFRVDDGRGNATAWPIRFPAPRPARRGDWE